MLFPPRDPNSSENVLFWAREVSHYLRAIRPIQGRGAKLDFTPNGVRFNASAVAGSGGGGSYVDNGCFKIVTRIDEGTEESFKTFANNFFMIGGVLHQVADCDIMDFSELTPGEDLPDPEPGEEAPEYATGDHPWVVLKVRMQKSSDGNVGDSSIVGLQKFDASDTSVPDAEGDNLTDLSNDPAWYIRPLYKISHTGGIVIDFRNMPDLSPMEV